MTCNTLPLFTDPIELAFAEFDAANPEVWRLFCRFTRDVIVAGHAHYSADAILHRIRWHTSVETLAADGFKINDHFSALYARKWLAANPGRAGFFRTRRRKT